MLVNQDPKYTVDENGNIVNVKTNKLIPYNEPIIIFRAKDKNAALAIAYYKKLCSNDEHKNAVNQRLHDFVEFAHNHPELMKEPDTNC